VNARGVNSGATRQSGVKGGGGVYVGISALIKQRRR